MTKLAIAALVLAVGVVTHAQAGCVKVWENVCYAYLGCVSEKVTHCPVALPFGYGYYGGNVAQPSYSGGPAFPYRSYPNAGYRAYPHY